MNSKKRSRVREPVQVYLDETDRALLEEVARRAELPRAEVLRRGLRAFAGEVLAERKPGWSLELLIGSLPDGPADLSERHDDYLVQALEEQRRRPG
ncbi:MAG: hypothetical protein ACREMI_15140 [Gemmatimonadales bacterium]